MHTPAFSQLLSTPLAPSLNPPSIREQYDYGFCGLLDASFSRHLIMRMTCRQDLEGKSLVDELRPEVMTTNAKAELPQCISMAWSADGQTLFAGYTDNLIRVWQVSNGATR